MESKNPKKEEEIPEGFMKRDHVAVILEDIRSQNNVFGDGTKGLSERFDGLSQRFDALSEKMDQGFEEVFRRLDRINLHLA